MRLVGTGIQHRPIIPSHTIPFQLQRFLMTSTDLTTLPSKTAVIADPLPGTIDALEAQLFKTNPTRRAKLVTETCDLAPVVTADLAVWRDQVGADDTRCALGVIAEALDSAHLLIVAARRDAPRPWHPLLTQCDRCTRMRRHLADAAELLEWAMTVARSVSLTMKIDVQQAIRRDAEGRAVTVTTATLSLHE